MTTRRQIVLLVLPLFVGLAVIGGSLMAWLQLRTAERDFRIEVETAAIAITEFVSTTDLEPLVSGTPLAQGRLAPIFDRILRWKQVERIFVIDPSGRILADTLRNAPVEAGLLPAPPNREQSVQFGAPPEEQASRRFQAAVIAAQHPALRIGVEISAETYFARRQLIRRHVALVSAVTLGAGLVVSLGLALFVSWQFSRLRHLAGLVGEPEFERADQGASIQEVADVGSILGVMHSVLMETVDKTRRSLIDREYVRSDHALGRIFRERHRPPATWSGADVAAIFVAVGTPRIVQGTVAINAQAGAAFIGLLPADDGLAAALQARAASDYLASALRGPDLAAAARATRELFQLRELVVLRWSAGRLEEWHHRTDDVPFTAESTLPEVNPTVVSCLAPDDRARLAVYLRTYPSAPLERLSADLPALLAGHSSGIVLALRRASSEP
jgi:hypothetical protein